MTLIRADKLFQGARGWLILTGRVPIYCENLKQAKSYLGDKATGYWPSQRRAE